ncbi:heat shock 70 kDa protein 12A-like, partial [Saccostrea cucullata]|uniref:heat shock 70 kDa protein 12A-like n=1 Tax=Saccostrea cuccullata TaxID=36930 RepID=UPI002ED36D73
GTVDVTAHEILDCDKVKEVLRPSGGNWGGTIVDDSYISFITALVGQNTIKHFESKHALGLYELCREFEITKRKISPHSDLKTTIRFPTALEDSYREANAGGNVKALSEIFWQKEKRAISFYKDKLRIDTNTANAFFDESVSQIIQHLQTILNSFEGKFISTILLVGGFAESAVLFDAVRRHFPERHVIIPKEAGWAVLAGAVIFGHDSSLIEKRKSKVTYGVACSQLFDPDIHEPKYLFFRDGKACCNNMFHKHVEIDEIINVGSYQSDEIYELTSTFDFTWDIYSSEEKNPMYITDEGCNKIGTLRLPKRDVDLDSKMRIQMSFSNTEIEVKMTYTKTGESTQIFLEQ